MFPRSSRGRPESNSQGRPLDVRFGRLLDVISRLSYDQDVSLGRPRDSQIGSLGDVLSTLDGDVIGCPGDQYLPAVKLTAENFTARLAQSNSASKSGIPNFVKNDTFK